MPSLSSTAECHSVTVNVTEYHGQLSFTVTAHDVADQVRVQRALPEQRPAARATGRGLRLGGAVTYGKPGKMTLGIRTSNFTRDTH